MVLVALQVQEILAILVMLEPQEMLVEGEMAEAAEEEPQERVVTTQLDLVEILEEILEI